MGYNINTLADRILASENLEKFFTESILGGQTLDFLSDHGSVSEAPLNTTSDINMMKNTLVWQDGKVAKLAELGSTELTQASVYVAPIGFKQAYDSLALQSKFSGEVLKNKKKSKQTDDLMFGEAIVEDVTNLNKKDVEKLVWSGDKSIVDTNDNMRFADGFLTQLKTGTYDLSAITGANIVEKIMNAYIEMPSEVTGADDFRVFIGTKEYKAYRAKITDLNLFNAGEKDDVFGTSAKFHVVDGLDNSGKVVLARARNLQVKTDYEGANVQIEAFYVQNDDEMKIRGRFGLGMKPIFIQEIGVLSI
ncbi:MULTISPECIES: hypothetical protein [Sphingobacterium]|uniref:hypothetical protein n=1 Tax=Sphingobacterium TaxID=28453 RepID=UPI0013D8FC64|nr:MULTISPECIES: hypothetical protein [unclassified Sphingobacterium]